MPHEWVPLRDHILYGIPLWRASQAGPTPLRLPEPAAAAAPAEAEATLPAACPARALLAALEER